MTTYDARVRITFGLKNMQPIDEHFRVEEFAGYMVKLTMAAAIWSNGHENQKFTIDGATVRDGKVVITLVAVAAIHSAAGYLKAFEDKMEFLAKAAVPFADPYEIIMTKVSIDLSGNSAETVAAVAAA
jgi:hypothetical protein